MPAFQATCQTPLQQGLPPANTRPVRGFSHADSRFGFLPSRRRRLTARGVQPVGPVQPGFAWGSVDGAVEPTTGERCFWARPSLHADLFQLFVDAFAPAFPHRLNSLLLDHRGAHTAARRTLPENVRLLFCPPYGPELSPLERGWRDLKDNRAWQPCAALEAQQDGLSTLLRAYEADTLQSLTGYPYLVEAM